MELGGWSYEQQIPKEMVGHLCKHTSSVNRWPQSKIRLSIAEIILSLFDENIIVYVKNPKGSINY